jgi:hypothetical protein
MPEIDLSYVGYCGVVCGKCGAFTKGKCRGCRETPLFARCPVRRCAVDRGLTSCAVCDADYEQCRKINNLIAAMIRLILRRDRRKNLAAIREIGIERFVADRLDLSGARKIPVK